MEMNSNYNAITKADGNSRLSPAYPYFASDPSSGEAEVKRMWGVLRRRWRLMATVFACVMILGALYVVCKRPVYESTAMVTVVTNQLGPTGSGELRVLTDLQALTRSASVQSHIQLITRPDVLTMAASQMRPGDMKKGFGSLTVPKWAVTAGLADKDSDVIAITAKAYDPNVAADYANAVVNAYTERDQKYSQSATRRGREYVLYQLNTVQKQLSEAQGDLAAYKRKVKIVAPESQVAAITGNMVGLQNELDKASVEYASMQREVQSLHSQLVAQGEEVKETTTIQVNPRYQNAVTALDALNARKATLGQDYAPGSREMRKLNGEINATNRQLKRIAQTMVASTVHSRNPVMTSYLASIAAAESAHARVDALKHVLAAHESQVRQLPAFESDFSRLTTRVNLLQGIYQDLSQKYYVLLVNENSTLPNARLASAAIPPPHPSEPNKPRSAVVFLMLGLLASALAAKVAERLDLRVRDTSMPELLLGEQPLGLIPHSDNAGAFVESFRTLRNVICSREIVENHGVMVITSPGRDEGKRTVCINLAVSMAWSGRKVLLVDADLRQPSLAASMNVPGDVGLTNLICGLVTAEEAIHPTSVDNIYCMPAGPAPYYPSQFLNSNSSLEILRNAAKSFDMVIVNGPPCVGLSDIQVVARAADAVAMVVMMGKTSREDIRESLHSLFRVNAPYAGYIMNCADDPRLVSDYKRAAEASMTEDDSGKPALLGELNSEV